MTLKDREVVEQLGTLTLTELRLWVSEGWVTPDDEQGFAEIDVARVRLVCQLRRDMNVNEDAVPVVLSLLDQLLAFGGSGLRIHSWGVRDWGACDEAFECFWATDERRGGWLHPLSAQAWPAGRPPAASAPAAGSSWHRHSPRPPASTARQRPEALARRRPVVLRRPA